jgi:putative Holliday junction resolvase
MAVLSTPFDLPAGRILALDLGRARIGVAVSDESGVLATPLTVVSRHSTRRQDFEALARLTASERAAGILVGLPLGGQGEPGVQARWAQRYGGRLAGAVQVPVAFWDESYSTVDAVRLLAEGGGRASVDAAAAAVFLGEFLEARRARGSSGQTRSSVEVECERSDV